MYNDNIAIIGFGIGGKSVLYNLYKNNTNEITIYDKNYNVTTDYIKPWYHIHAGAFCYPKISNEDCLKMFYNALYFCKIFSEYIYHIPTIIAYNKLSSEEYLDPLCLQNRCEFIKNEYMNYTKSNDPILLNPDNFYKLYSKDDFDNIRNGSYILDYRNIHDLYVVNFVRKLKDSESIKYPFASVMEPKVDYIKINEKINNIAIDNENSIKIINVKVNDINYWTNGKINKFQINNNELYDKVIVCTGHGTKSIKINNIDNIEVVTDSYEMEFKMSWVYELAKNLSIFDPEIVIIGQRGTENGIIQSNPYRCIDEKNNLTHVHSLTINSTIITQSHINTIEELQNMENDQKKYSECDNSERGENAIQRLQLLFNDFDDAKLFFQDKIMFYGGLQRACFDIENRNSLFKVIDEGLVDMHVTKRYFCN